MTLFSREPSPIRRVEPVPPTDLQLAQREFHDASVACRQSAEVCTRLDWESRFWLQRREDAQRSHNECLLRYSRAQDRLQELQSTVIAATGKISATGTTQPISAATLP